LIVSESRQARPQRPEDRRLAGRRVAAFAWLLPFTAASLGLVLLTGLFAGIVLAAGGAVSGGEVVAAGIATGVGLACWLRRVQGERWWMSWLLMIAVTVGALGLNVVFGGRVLDDTWDGQWYHQEAIIQLVGGWNPTRAELGRDEVADDGARFRINAYPKATWLWGASMVALTHRIEHGKSFSLLLMLAAAAASLAGLLVATRIGAVGAVAVAVVAAANPVVVTQILNSYQDGALASLMTTMIACLALWIRTESRAALAVAAAASVGVASIKLSGPVYVVVLVGAAAAWMWWIGGWRRQRLAAATAFGTAVVGVILVSGGSYACNAVRHGHPLYPIFGPEATAIVEVPPHDRFQTAAVSMFSRSQLTPDVAETVARLESRRTLKVPLTVDAGELEAFRVPNVRIGGLGPLAGGLLLLGTLLLVVTGIICPSYALLTVAAIAPVVATVLINPYCWFARYVPQLWLIPLLIAVSVLAVRPNRFAIVLAWLVIVLAGANSAAIGVVHAAGVVRHSRELKSRLLELGGRRQRLELDLGAFRSNRARLAELGIDFDEVRDPRRSLPVYLGYSPLHVTDVEIERAPDGGGIARLGWTPAPGVDAYVVEAVMAAPVGPGGGALSVARTRTLTTAAVLPIPAGPVTIIVGHCNALGCSRIGFVGPVACGGTDRPMPVIATPAEPVVTDPSMVFSWLPAAGEPGRPSRYRFILASRDTGRVVVSRETGELWSEHRFGVDGLWTAAVSLIGAEDGARSEVDFETRGVAAPRVVAPTSGARIPAGPVAIAWLPVAEATGYEVFVAVTGEPGAVARRVTRATSVVVELGAADGVGTTFSIIARACPKDEECREGSDVGWGPWSHDAGFGDVKVTVMPPEHGPEDEPRQSRPAAGSGTLERPTGSVVDVGGAA